MFISKKTPKNRCFFKLKSDINHAILQSTIAAKNKNLADMVEVDI